MEISSSGADNKRPYVKTVGHESTCDYVVDGTADDVQIQQAIDDMIASSYDGVIELGAGNFDITAKITIPNDSIGLIGQGKDTQLIQADKDTDVLEVGDGTTYYSYNNIKHFKILGTGTSGTGKLLKLNYVKYGIFEGLSLNNAPHSALYLDNHCRYNKFIGLECDNAVQYGLYITNSTNTSNTHNT